MLSRSFVIVAAAVQSAQSQITSSFKRGLVYVPSAKYPQDDYLWDSPTSDITWYYNYGVMPSRSYADSKLQFVPQLWGQPSDSNSTAFLDSVQSQIRGGANISHVLAFNEPDMTANVGGSSIDPTTAAHVWRQEIEPLASLGVKLGSPACSSGPAGVSWMQDFLQACSECTIDFMAVHFYGDFQGLASHIGQYVGTFNKTVWVTEYADPHASLGEAQSFFNQSVTFMDRNPNVTRYSYFGAFRSDVSNIGGNAAFLTQKGRLTDIGSWYLGGSQTGNLPSAAMSWRKSIAPVGLLTVMTIFGGLFLSLAAA